MPFPGPGPGRPKGSLSRSQVEAKAIMKELGFNPIHELIKRYYDKSLKEDTHNQMLKELVSRYAPALRAVELTGADGSQLETLIRVVHSTPDIIAQIEAEDEE